MKSTTDISGLNLKHSDKTLQEADVITVKKKAVCPRCGMTVKEGGKMFRSLKIRVHNVLNYGA